MNEEKIIHKLLDIEAKMDQVTTKKDLQEFRDENIEQHDLMMTMLTRLDQERIFTQERIKRLEEDFERIKIQLKIA